MLSNLYNSNELDIVNSIGYRRLMGNVSILFLFVCIVLFLIASMYLQLKGYFIIGLLLLTFPFMTMIFIRFQKFSLGIFMLGVVFPILILITHVWYLKSAERLNINNDLGLTVFYLIILAIIPVIYQQRSVIYYANAVFIFALILTSNFVLGYSKILSLREASRIDNIQNLYIVITGIVMFFIIDRRKKERGENDMFLAKVNLELKNEIIEKERLILKSIQFGSKLHERVGSDESVLMEVFDTIPDLVWLKDLDGKYLACNKEFEKFIGAIEADIIGKTDFDFLSKELASFFRANDLKAVRAGKTLKNEEYLEYKSSDKKIMVETSKTPYYDSDGRVAGVLGVVLDITDRKTAEKLQVFNEQKYIALIESASDAIYLLNEQSVIVSVNTAATIMLGYAREELEGSKLHVINADWDEYKFALWIERAEPDSNEISESYFKTKEGIIIPVEINSRKTKIGDIVYAHVVVRDILERKSYEYKLKLANNALKEAQRLTKVGSWHFDVINDKRYLSDEIYHIYDEKPQSFKETADTYYKYLHPEVRELIVNALTKSVVKKKPFNGIHKIITAIGNVRYVEEHAQIELNENNEVIGAYGTVQDVTEEVKTKNTLENQLQKLNLALKANHLISYEFDYTENIMTLFPEKMGDWDVWNNIQKIDDLVTYINPEQRFICQRKIDDLLSGKVDSFNCEVQMGSDELGWKWMLATMNSLVRNEQNVSTRVFGILSDISGKKNNESLEIEAQEKERLRMSRDIHDSIGQMLVGTRMMLHKTLSGDLSYKETKEINLEVDEMLNQVIRETRLVINNLGLNVFENKDLHASFNFVAEKMKRVFQGEIVVNWKGKKEFNNMKLATNIFRIFQESLTNSIKYSGANKITVEANVDGLFNLKIRDNGAGFNAKGTENGFGITNMHERAKNIGGILKIQSKEGVGTEVSLVIS